jgi:hypothetical protein
VIHGLMNRKTEITVAPYVAYNSANHPTNHTTSASLMPLLRARLNLINPYSTHLYRFFAVGIKETVAVGSEVIR